MNNFDFDKDNQARVVNPDTAGLGAFFKKVYTYMFLALLVTGVTAYVGATVFASQIVAIFSSSVSQLILFGVLLGFVWMFSRQVFQNPAKAFGMLMGYAVLNGAMLSVIGLAYNLTIIVAAFSTTSLLFGGMAFYGFATRKSMASMGSILFGSVIALIIGGIINMFFFNSIVYLFLSVVGVVVFALLTAYDMNRLKSMYLEYGDHANANANANVIQGLAVSGALNLYMDFINLFLYILRLFGIFGGNQD